MPARPRTLAPRRVPGAERAGRGGRGRSWGADGVLRLKKGSNVCGVATNAVYARLAGGAAGAAAPAALE